MSRRQLIRSSQHDSELREAWSTRILRGERARVEDGAQDADVWFCVPSRGPGYEVSETRRVNWTFRRREDNIDYGHGGHWIRGEMWWRIQSCYEIIQPGQRNGRYDM